MKDLLSNHSALHVHGAEPSFSVTLQKYDQCPIGMAIGRFPDGPARVVGLGDGVASLWNTKHPARAIHLGDMLIEVNQVSESLEGMVKEMRCAQVLQLRLQHAEEACAVSEDCNEPQEALSAAEQRIQAIS